MDRLIVHPDAGLQEVARGADGRAGWCRRPPRATAPDGQGQALPPGPAADELRRLVGHDRVWPLGVHGQRNTWMADGMRSLGGYHPAKLAKYEQIRRRLYGDAPAGRLANWLGATVVAYDQPFAAGDLDYLAGQGVRLAPQPLHAGRPAFYRNESALPRARLVAAWRPQSALPRGGDLPAFLDAVQAGTIAVADTVTLDRPPEPAPAAGPLPVPTFTRDTFNEVVLETAAPGPAVLLLADMNAPGWQVEVDGSRRPLLTADLVLRAVALEAGPHTVRFFYRDPSVRAGLTLSLLGLALVAALLTLSFRRRPLPTPPGADDE